MDDDICPICFNNFEKDINGKDINFAITNCNHKFCLSCIVRHGKHKNLCPMCRGEFLDPKNFSPRSFNNNDENNLVLDNFNLNNNSFSSWFDYYNINEPLLSRNTILSTTNLSNETNENIRNLSNRINNTNILTNNFYDEVLSLQYSSDESLEEIPIINSNNNNNVEIDTYLLYNQIYDEALSIINTDDENEVDEENDDDDEIQSNEEYEVDEENDDDDENDN